MLVVAVITQIGLMLAYALNGMIPWTYPISLLGDRHERISYHAVLGLLLVSWTWYLVHCWRARIGLEMILAVIIGLLLAALQFTANEDAGHDGLAAAAMVAVGLLTVRIAYRLASLGAMVAALASFACCSLVVSGNMVVVGCAENLVLAVALGLLTWDCRRTPAEPAPAARQWTGPGARASGPASWPPGVAAGLAWALVCFLIISVGIGCDGILAGPLVLVVCWCGGFAAWRTAQPTWLRGGLLSGGFIGALMLVSWLFGHSVQFSTLLVVTVLFVWVLLMVLVLDFFTATT